MQSILDVGVFSVATDSGLAGGSNLGFFCFEVGRIVRIDAAQVVNEWRIILAIFIVLCWTPAEAGNTGPAMQVNVCSRGRLDYQGT